ncbi:MAG: tubulin-like doman-containing protein, partial [Fusobacteriaceae bacterium]
IEQYLAKNNTRDKVKSWFVTEHPSILKKSFASGAGQIRAISRLAYMASIGEGRLQTLDKKLSGMLKNEGNADIEEIRIMIVSSLVGGTGAGIFLQTALYLKDYFESLGKSVMIRGTFLLPDIFIKTGIITNQQTKNILANGYACLKELNAIIGATSSTNTKAKSTIELEYKPDMKDTAISKNPYDFAFLYDYENTEGNHLGNYEQYLRQISKIVHLQLSTEVAGRADSIEVNNIIHAVSEDGMARYASAGVSTIEYPYEDILKYCGLKLANEKIGSRWLKLDKIFENMLEKQILDIKNGIYQEPMKKYEKLNELFDAEIKNNDQFFKTLNRSLY